MLRLVLTVTLMVLSISYAHAGNKIALVIGNSGYHSTAPLATARNDMRLIADSLRPLGFEVTAKADVDRFGLRQAIAAFTDRLSRLDKDAVSVFYYSGHGVQNAGQNYLVPLGAQVSLASQIERETVPLSFLLSRLSRVGNRLNIVVLDASRERPLGDGFLPIKEGLALVKASPNTVIVLSSAPGTNEFSGYKKHSMFAAALSEALGKREKSMKEMFASVGRTLIQESEGRQKSWVMSSRALEAFLTPQTKPVARHSRWRSSNRFRNRLHGHRHFFRQRDIHTRTRSGRQPVIARERVRVQPRPPQQEADGLVAKPKELPVVAKLEPPEQKPAQQEVANLEAPQPAESALPMFPWPPHKPSVQIRLPRTAFARAQNLSSVASLIVDPLRAAGYWEHSFYAVPNGFALVTRLERINPDGSRPNLTISYAVEEDADGFSLTGYIKRLFFASPGYFRLIVFVVSGEPFTTSKNTLKQARALDLLRSGANTLPPAYEKIMFDNTYGVDALIYEFKKDRQGDVAAQLQPGRISPLVHLTKAGLSSAFGIKGN